ncbi:MAG TPA: hypothetical protein DCG06_11620 [Deltaproteobacteria bacterium]|nr:hypothetical protein [Deltaproteobacteria bacterium]
MVGRPRSDFGRARVLLALVALTLLTGVYFRGVVFGDQTLSAASYVPGVLPSGPVGGEPPPWPRPMRDAEGAAWVDEPAPWIVGASLRAGAWPLWNDREGLGMPLLGNPNAAVLSPFSIPVALAPSSRMQDFAWLARVLFLGWATVLLAREFGFRFLPALGAGLAVAFSGQTVQWIEHHPLNVDAFVPLALAAALALIRQVPAGGPLLALAVAAGCLGLKPQSALVAGLAAVVWLLAGVPASRGRLHWQRLFGWTLLGMGLAAVALFPFWESWTQASGLVGAGRRGQSEWTLPFAQIVSLAGPWALPESLVPAGLPWLGVSVLVLAAYGALRGYREALVLVWLATVAIYLARIFGGLPLPLSDVPLLGSVQWIKYSFPLYLACGLLAARGLEALPTSGRLLAFLLVGAEMLFLVPRAWPVRTNPYAPAPWVTALRELNRETPGRLSGAVSLAPPLVSGALGFRDLRSIDVLTPARTWEFVQRTLAPSEGITWVLADPDPLLVATGAGGPSANLRWILSPDRLELAQLPGAVRAMSVGERTVRLFAHLEAHRFSTAYLFGGRTRRGDDERFHWICETPCELEFDLSELSTHLVAGFTTGEPSEVQARVSARHDGKVLASNQKQLVLAPDDDGWRDLEIEISEMPPSASASLVVSLTAPKPTRVFVGGVGLSPGQGAESRHEEQDLVHRSAAFDQLILRYVGDGLYLYERRDALGAAYFADRVVSVGTSEEVFSCVRRHGGASACVVGPAIAEARGGAEVAVLQDGPNAMLLQAEGPGGLLVVSRLAAAGFEARAGGEVLPTQQVNGALLGFRVPPGSLEVKVLYAPRSVHWGLWVSGASLLIWLLFAGRLRFADGRRPQ